MEVIDIVANLGPATAAVVTVIFFLKYLHGRDTDQNELMRANQQALREAANAMGKTTEAVRRCSDTTEQCCKLLEKMHANGGQP